MTKREKLYATYCTYERDTDGSYYWWPKDNLITNPEDFPDELGDVCFQWKLLTQQWMFIKSNWLAFTWKGHPYVWYSPTRSSHEWQIIKSLITGLKEIGCTDVLYEPGELD